MDYESCGKSEFTPDLPVHPKGTVFLHHHADAAYFCLSLIKKEKVEFMGRDAVLHVNGKAHVDGNHFVQFSLSGNQYIPFIVDAPHAYFLIAQFK